VIGSSGRLRALLRLDPGLAPEAAGAHLTALSPAAGTTLDDVLLVGDVADEERLAAWAAADLVYLLSAASLIAPLNLDAGPDDTVLDACAAPGGKTLVTHLAFPGARLHASEYSRARRAHLARLLGRVAPDVPVWGLDARDLRRLPFEAPTRVLLDAPCSGEAHLEAAGQAEVATEARSKALASRQKAMLMAAFQALAPGGRLVYATCTASPHEDEVVIARFLRRVGARARLVPARAFGLPARPGLDAYRGRDLSHVGPLVLRTDPEDGLTPSFCAVIEKLG